MYLVQGDDIPENALDDLKRMAKENPFWVYWFKKRVVYQAARHDSRFERRLRMLGVTGKLRAYNIC